MSVIVVSGALREQLLALYQAAEVRDEAGNLLGTFEPPKLGVPDWNPTQEELDRLLAPDAKTYTTAEVLAYLKSLTP